MARTFREIAAQTGMKKEAVLPPFSPASAIFNYAANSARETGALDPLYKKEALTGVLEGLEGKGRHPFMDGLWASSPMSQVLDPGRPAGNLIGQTVRDQYKKLPESHRQALLDAVTTGHFNDTTTAIHPDFSTTHTKLPYDTKHAVGALAHLPGEEAIRRLSVPDAPTSRFRGPKIDRAMYHAGSLIGGAAHFGTGGAPLASYDITGPLSTSGYKEGIDQIHREVDYIKSRAMGTGEKAAPKQFDLLSKKPLPRPSEIRPILSSAPHPSLKQSLLRATGPLSADNEAGRRAQLHLMREEMGIPSSLGAAERKAASDTVLRSLDEAQKSARTGYLDGRRMPLKDAPAFQAASQFGSGLLQEAARPVGPIQKEVRTHLGRTTNVALRGATEPLFRAAEAFPDKAKKISDAMALMHGDTFGSRARAWLSRQAGRVAGLGRFK